MLDWEVDGVQFHVTIRLVILSGVGQVMVTMLGVVALGIAKIIQLAILDALLCICQELIDLLKINHHFL